jgi:hypothetical protein
MTDTPPPLTEPRPAPTVHVSEDDLEALLAGETITLSYGVPPEEGLDPIVVWEPDPFAPLDVAAVRALHGDGLPHRVRIADCDEPVIPNLRVGTDRAARDPERRGEIQVTLTEEGYRMLCGLVQTDRRLNREEVNGTAWAELRRTFPAAEYVRQPSGRIEVGGLAGPNALQAEIVARQMVVDSLQGQGDYDIVVLAAVLEADGRYSVTVVYHHPELSEHGTRRLHPAG